MNVDELPRRTAHAMHALIVSTEKMPATAAEVAVRDEEAVSVVATGAALREAARKGLAVRAGRYWVPTFAALDLKRAFEARFLNDTERDDDE